jgi:hypothetical protein
MDNCFGTALAMGLFSGLGALLVAVRARFVICTALRSIVLRVAGGR